ncbi:hypothetical protein A8L45_15285 [Veronia pacifica]|uniref:Uncharacterized protein n=1 Tax=Veronia pacifica TaxID=1080227 RepID=A0A1C3EES7_9GAMM|nr:hypothetical protein A8L45_15285 [Veronia pacifica]
MLTGWFDGRIQQATVFGFQRFIFCAPQRETLQILRVEDMALGGNEKASNFIDLESLSAPVVRQVVAGLNQKQHFSHRVDGD